ncbi:benzoate-CoA ligase family protein [Desulfobacter vibrioformis]|uniref:benzoate-CoA ligase family protein n=1 Tax=Desulfobacter vibrioformis TaxID=34031 RepID=UPI000550E6C2|nr:benzoate-CoA ligase family protein [Desulfobacter vibrioformis]
MNGILNAASELVDPNVSKNPDKTAIYYRNEKISYGALQEGINRFGKLLAQTGVRPGERLIIALPDSPAFFYAFLGSIRHGAWPVPLSPALSRTGYDFIVQDAGAVALVTRTDCSAAQASGSTLRHRFYVDTPEYAAGITQASPELAPHPSRETDIAFMLYSSGSTGNPKGVPHRHRDMVATADTYARQVLDATETDRFFSVAKLFFAFGLGNSLSFPLRAGASVILNPDPPTPPDILNMIGQYRPTLFFAVPTIYNMLLKTMETESLDTGALRLCVSAGEALPADLFHDWKRLTGVEILDGIGSTEALHIFLSNRAGQVRPGTSGTPVPGWETKVVDENGRAVPPGTLGRLWIRGDATAPHYWNRPEKTRETMREEGWLDTGDVYIQTPGTEGAFVFQGRGDDMFKVDANWVSPIRVEAVLREHPAVLECAVSHRRLEGLAKPLALVVLRPGFEGNPKLVGTLRRHVLANLPAYMCPVQIDFVQGLPKTETGKVQRFRLKKD